eukprot:6225717-Prymnesium_polylepis.1
MRLGRGGGAGEGGARVGADLRWTTAAAHPAPPPGRTRYRTPLAHRAPCPGRSPELRRRTCCSARRLESLLMSTAHPPATAPRGRRRAAAIGERFAAGCVALAT